MAQSLALAPRPRLGTAAEGRPGGNAGRDEISKPLAVGASTGARPLAKATADTAGTAGTAATVATAGTTGGPRANRTADRLVLSTRPRDGERPASMGEAAAQGAAEGARIGGLVGNGAIGLMMIRKGLQGAASIPRTTWFGRALPWMGIVFSGLGAVGATRNLVGALQSPERETKRIAGASMDLAGNLLIAGGSVAILAGAFAAPALLATGAGFLLTTAAGFLAD